ncbi:hypothetical protein F5882DRAFT_388121 [Hyaloscypha sp. PMI_1271]|nr:hypothetical protein F5882DRAFT_388121 [Hyaloscypha sp. PMI_1271]
MCFTPFPPMRQHAVLFPVGHRLAFKLFRLALLSPRTVSGAIMHNSSSNTNQLGSPPHNAHCRLLYWRSICHMAASVTQPHPRP